MFKFTGVIKRALFVLPALLIAVAFPLRTLADTAPTTSTAPAQGPIAPTGPDANTYTYNSATGMWENAYYIWDPATGLTTPKTPQTYSYNPATGHWDTTDWLYDAASGQYVPNTVSVDQPPAGAPTTGGPTANAAVSPSTDATTQGPSSPVSGSTNTTSQFDNFYNASISNSITAQALSGSANVTLNTTGGNATSGNATDIANIINLLQSTTDLQGGLTTFSFDVPTTVGDITIDPGQLPSNSGLSSSSQPTNSNVTINSQASGQINNVINLGATSGDATVSQNTTAGNAATGSAQTIANIMNIINSIIASGKSFVGTINIQGDFNGDILLPQDTLNNLLTANTSGPNSPTTGGANNTLNATLTDNTGITNTLNLSAASGSANVTNNTTGGNATTGSATTNITLLNLTGKQVIGSDALLVFVNVMGSWVGMIVNAPAGATSAALCNCSTAGPNSPISGSQNTNTNVSSTTNNSINNNVTLASLSGNALVSNNTTGGNATSGNATAGANILNLSNSSLSLANWFGILFINVFGNWTGSFGINTSAGDLPTSSSTSNDSSAPTISQSVSQVKVFGFIPTGASNTDFHLVQLASASGNGTNQTGGAGTVLKPITTATSSSQPHNHSTSLFWTAGSLFFLAGVLSAEEAVARRKEARQKIRNYLHSITVQPFKQD